MAGYVLGGLAMGTAAVGINRTYALYQQLEALRAAAAEEEAADAAPPVHKKKRSKMRDYSFKRKNWESDVLDFLTPIEFRRRYGLSVPAFEYVLGLIRDDITDAADGHGGARNSAPMPPEMKLAATLRWLRGIKWRHARIFCWRFT